MDPNGEFAADAPGQLMKQGVPHRSTNDAATQAPYDVLVQKVCPCIIMTHSQGGNFGLTAARHAPDKVRAMISTEPSGVPDPAAAPIAPPKSMPHLVIYGNHLGESPFWQRILQATTRYREALAVQGGVAGLIDLSAQGIRGNTHMLMMDRNSDQVIGLVQDWMARQGLMR